MPFWDRCWWLRSLLALGFGAATAFAAARLWMAPDDFGFALGDLPARVALAVAMLGLLALSALGIWSAGLRARRRKRLRLAAIAGPPPLLTASAAQPLEAPIALLWRRSLWALADALWRDLCLAAALWALLSLWIVPALDVPLSNWRPSHLPEIFGQFQTPILISVALVVVALLAAHVWWLRRPWGVIAREDGLTFRRRLSRSREARWDELRLLEVRDEGRNAEHYQTYLLYSTQGIGRWHLKSTDKLQYIVPVGMSREEARQRASALESLVRERTGLVPRRIDSEASTPSDERRAGLGPRGSWENLGCLSAIGLVALGCGALLVVWRMSSDTTFNWVVGASLPGALVLAAVPLALGGLVRRLRGGEARGSRFREDEALPEPPGWAYEVRTSFHWGERVSFLLFGLAGLLSLAPAVALWFPSQLSALVPPWQVIIQDGFGTVATYFLLWWGLVAVVLLLVAFLSRVEVVRADAEGLTKLRGRRMKARIAWGDLQRLSPMTLHGRSFLYRATGNHGRTRIQWSTALWGASSPRPGPRVVTAAQLFALAAKHSGVVPDAVDD